MNLNDAIIQQPFTKISCLKITNITEHGSKYKMQSQKTKKKTEK